MIKKIMTMTLIFSLMMGLFSVSLGAGNHTEDMRAVWVSTIYNSDYPAKKNDPTAQKQEFIQKLDTLKNAGMNTMVVQVRPKSDALYKSTINPWSDVLTGVQGQDPGYDPMAFMIEETHKRGMDFHAWLNPYRITTTGTDTSVLSENHPARLHPEWIISHNNALYYNPDLEEVRIYIRDTVKEIVDNYDLDGIHFDDYFYPSNYPLPQGEGRDGTVANQRRENVNNMVKMVNDAIKQSKPDVLFGISPAGIWKNSSSDPSASATKGNEAYYSVSADARSWIKAGIIDYIVPQIYWEIGYKIADYETLVKWWSNEVKDSNVKLYIGQGIYRDAVADQIDTQLAMNKNDPNVKGSFFFSTKDIINNRKGCTEKISNFYNGKMTPPVTPAAPTINAAVTKSKVIVNGKTVEVEAYNINDNNYFKLRDIAASITGTDKQFNTVWDEVTLAINLKKGESYAITGGELVKGDGKDKSAATGTAKMYIDDQEISSEQAAAYLINGNHYYKLRDIGKLFNFSVKWQASDDTVFVDTSGTYIEE